jgi:hypothetical protein
MSMSRLTPAERSARARLAALERWSRLDPAAREAQTRAARDGLARKWEQAPNPDAAKRAHMTRMALAASKKKRRAA